MEMCIDNPRTGFSNLFDTHPPVESRIAALVQFAGGHDPGPIELPEPGETPPPAAPGPQTDQEPPASGPWSSEPPAPPAGPWGPQRPN
jgi:heat shock protein HtpX